MQTNYEKQNIKGQQENDPECCLREWNSYRKLSKTRPRDLMIRPRRTLLLFITLLS